MGCPACPPASRAVPIDKPAPKKRRPPEGVLVRVRNHTDDYSWLIGQSGQKYSLRRNGSEVRVSIDDYIADLARFEAIEDELQSPEVYEGVEMRCDLEVAYQSPKTRICRCIRCGQITGLVSNETKLFVQCAKPGFGDRVAWLLRWFEKCAACARRQNWLNNWDRQIYRLLKGPKNASYLEKRLAEVSSPFAGWRAGIERWRNGWRHAGRPVPTRDGRGQRSQRGSIPADPGRVR